MSLISLMIQPMWQTYLDELCTAFVNDEGAEGLDNWRKLDFTDRLRYLVEKNALPSDSDWVKRAFLQSRDLTEKRNDEACELMKIGDQVSARGHHHQALEQYNQALSCATAPTTMGEIYAHRSAALFRLEEYKLCVLDVRRALLYDMAPPVRHELYSRRAHCYRKLGYSAAARKDFEEAVRLQKDDSVESNDDLRQQCEDLRSDLAESDQPEEVTEPEVNPYPSQPIPEVMNGPSEHVTQASTSVNLKYSPEQGRYLEAGADLSRGDVLIVEKPYAAVLLPDRYSTHCHHCFVRTRAPVACAHCPIALYCSETCRDESWSRYHHVECQFLPIMNSIGIAHLALRIVVTSGLKNLIDFRGSDIGSSDDVTRKYEFGYQSVYNLLHHTDSMETEDLIQYGICAVLLLRCLQKSDFFNKDTNHETTSKCGDSGTDGSTVSDDSTSLDDVTISFDRGDVDDDVIMYVGGVLLRHMQQLACNAHSISELTATSDGDPANRVMSVEDGRVATAIYPTASLMNHSCGPNILPSFHGDLLIVRSSRAISKGEEIHNCYGPHCKRMARHERQDALRTQYFFTCACQHCSGTVVEKFKSLKCPKCDGPLPRPEVDPDATVSPADTGITCQSCQNVCSKEELNNILPVIYSSRKFLAEGGEAFRRGDYKGARKAWNMCLKLQKQVLYKEHEDLARTTDQLAMLHAQEGKFGKAATYLEFSTKIIGRKFGYQSVEYAMELGKLAQLEFNDKSFISSRDHAQRALGILKPVLPDNEESIVDLIKIVELLSQDDGAQPLSEVIQS